MSFDLAAALRRHKPQRRAPTLRRRPDRDLSWIESASRAGAPVLLDTTVYIDILQGRSPTALDELISLRTCNHSSVCLAELTHLFGRMDPADNRTAAVLRNVEQTIADIPDYRLLAPDAETWGVAGMLAGLLFRLGSYQPGAERKCLNDALVFLQGRKIGCQVVTANVRDFDYLNQLVPEGRVLLYRTGTV